ncbi:Nramp family divalent metal transporter [candidate division KSB1 bacterium]|nr:Nramp family divalent metal transporter [candidate division KSB1 bacterium]
MNTRSTPPASLSEVHRTVGIPDKVSAFRRLLAFAGPAYLVSVGYMDPGNWATDIEGGSRFGYQLIWVLLMSNMIAVLLQALSARLGIVTGRDLARACREAYPRPVGLMLWVVCEIAIVACDLAEVLGTAIALNLLFGLPLLWGVVLTALDVLLLLYFQHLGIRKVEAFILALVLTIGACFVLEMFLSKPDFGGIALGFTPRLNQESLYVAIGILGATVMPHNLYLHSALVQTRKVGNTSALVRQACKYNLVDSAIALNAAFFVNAGILILAAAVFHRNAVEVTEIQQAHQLLAPLLGTTVASAAFAIALLCSGQSSTLTGTMAGQVVMEGFVNLRIRPWLRRMITRSLAIVPAVLTLLVLGDSGTYQLLILSQVVLSMQLPFAILPLIHFTSDQSKMGEFANRTWVKMLAWIAAILIIGLNVRLVSSILGNWISASPAGPQWYHVLVLLIAAGLAVLLLYLAMVPILRRTRKRAEALPTFHLEAVPEAVYRRVGVAIEVSATDAKLVRQGVAMAKRYDSELALIHVMDGLGPRFWREQSSDHEVVGDEAYMANLRDEVAKLGVNVRVVLGYGNPPDEIVRIVHDEDIDLLIMGTHGHRFTQDILFGATATRVRHRVQVPVFMVRVEA